MNYLVKIIRYNDGTPTTKSIIEYKVLKEALGNCYKEFGAWMLKSNCEGVMCEVTDDYGNHYENKHWPDEVEENGL